MLRPTSIPLGLTRLFLGLNANLTTYNQRYLRCPTLLLVFFAAILPKAQIFSEIKISLIHALITNSAQTSQFQPPPLKNNLNGY
jgi:hypothetical protein